MDFFSQSSWMRHDLHQVGKSTAITNNINNPENSQVLCMKSVWCVACGHKITVPVFFEGGTLCSAIIPLPFFRELTGKKFTFTSSITDTVHTVMH
jgi:hypothetical protein